MAAEMHEGKEAKQTVVVGIEITVIERLMLGVPKSINKLFALLMRAQHRGCSRRGDKPYAMPQFLEASGL